MADAAVEPPPPLPNFAAAAPVVPWQYFQVQVSIPEKTVPAFEKQLKELDTKFIRLHGTNGVLILFRVKATEITTALKLLDRARIGIQFGLVDILPIAFSLPAFLNDQRQYEEQLERDEASKKLEELFKKDGSHLTKVFDHEAAPETAVRSAVGLWNKRVHPSISNQRDKDHHHHRREKRAHRQQSDTSPPPSSRHRRTPSTSKSGKKKRSAEERVARAGADAEGKPLRGTLKLADTVAESAPAMLGLGTTSAGPPAAAPVDLFSAELQPVLVTHGSTITLPPAHGSPEKTHTSSASSTPPKSDSGPIRGTFSLSDLASQSAPSELMLRGAEPSADGASSGVEDKEASGAKVGDAATTPIAPGTPVPLTSGASFSLTSGSAVSLKSGSASSLSSSSTASLPAAGSVALSGGAIRPGSTISLTNPGSTISLTNTGSTISLTNSPSSSSSDLAADAAAEQQPPVTASQPAQSRPAINLQSSNGEPLPVRPGSHVSFAVKPTRSNDRRASEASFFARPDDPVPIPVRSGSTINLTPSPAAAPLRGTLALGGSSDSSSASDSTQPLRGTMAVTDDSVVGTGSSVRKLASVSEDAVGRRRQRSYSAVGSPPARDRHSASMSALPPLQQGTQEAAEALVNRGTRSKIPVFPRSTTPAAGAAPAERSSKRKASASGYVSELRATRFVVMDGLKRRRATFGLQEDGSIGLEMKGADGTTAIQMSVSAPEGEGVDTAVVVVRHHGHECMRHEVDSEGVASIRVRGKDGQSYAQMWVDEESTPELLLGKDGSAHHPFVSVRGSSQYRGLNPSKALVCLSGNPGYAGINVCDTDRRTRASLGWYQLKRILDINADHPADLSMLQLSGREAAKDLQDFPETTLSVTKDVAQLVAKKSNGEFHVFPPKEGEHDVAAMVNVDNNGAQLGMIMDGELRTFPRDKTQSMIAKFDLEF